MSDKKHIDRLFQEKLKDLDATPSSAVWDNISARLEQSKKDRKVIPLWWKIAGVAAALLLLLTLGNLVSGNDASPADQNTVVDTEADSDPNLNKNINSQDQDEIINIDDSGNSDILTEEDVDGTPNLNNVQDQNDKASELTSDKKAKTQNAVVNNQPTSIQNKKIDGLKKDEKRLQDAVTENKPEEKPDAIGDNLRLEKEKADELIESAKNEKSTAVTKADKVDEEIKEEGITKNDEETQVIKEAEKLSLAEAVEQEDEVSEEETDEPAEKRQRWSVLPNVAPVYFNSFGKGSAIDDQFNNNSISGEINLSYGLAGTYEINEKLSVRTGINQLKLGYSTSDVIVYNNIEPSVEDKPLKNVALNSSSQNLSFLSATGINAAQVPAIVAENISSSIDQKFGFIEIPMEVEYKLSDKAFNISVIGGFSTLFLNENEVYSSLQGERMLLGEATNIKNTSFSANLGLGVKYEISEKLNLNLNPVLKYHLNTFSDTSGDFNPYFIGVYSGISFKF